jgi:hypothetical protein
MALSYRRRYQNKNARQDETQVRDWKSGRAVFQNLDVSAVIADMLASAAMCNRDRNAARVST